MRAAILGPLAFLAVPGLIWPAEMADIVMVAAQGIALGGAVGLLAGLVAIR